MSADTDQPEDDRGGAEGTVPNTVDGVGVGAGDEPNTFEPEEEPEATAEGGAGESGHSGGKN